MKGQLFKVTNVLYPPRPKFLRFTSSADCGDKRTRVSYLGEHFVVLSIFGEIWIGCMYIYTSDWSGSCSEEGPLFEGAPHRCI